VWHVLGVTFRDLNYLNPLSYVSHAVYMPHDEPELNPATFWSPYILLGLTLVYLAAALVQWRRVEA
jgi:ABC-type multidrug transport system permease subunit